MQKQFIANREFNNKLLEKCLVAVCIHKRNIIASLRSRTGHFHDIRPTHRCLESSAFSKAVNVFMNTLPIMRCVIVFRHYIRRLRHQEHIKVQLRFFNLIAWYFDAIKLIEKFANKFCDWSICGLIVNVIHMFGFVEWNNGVLVLVQYDVLSQCSVSTPCY